VGGRRQAEAAALVPLPEPVPDVLVERRSDEPDVLVERPSGEPDVDERPDPEELLDPVDAGPGVASPPELLFADSADEPSDPDRDDSPDFAPLAPTFSARLSVR
jgi:hypothetical protein